MATEKVTVMILYVDLKCSNCYKKVKKVLCKFPQVRDQVYDEDKNKVTITVVCCDPENIRDRICCKGGKAIQCIEIVEDKPPKQPEKPSKEPEKPKVIEKKPSVKADKPKSDPKPPPVVVPVPVPVPQPKADPPKPDPPKPAPPKPDPPKVDPPKPDPPKADPPKPDPPKNPVPHPMPPVMMPDPMHGYPQPFCPPAYPVSVCCQECYEGRDGGPCHYGYGRPVPPPPGPCYDGYGYSYSGGRPCYVSRCDYFSEENPQGCSIM